MSSSTGTDRQPHAHAAIAAAEERAQSGRDAAGGGGGVLRLQCAGARHQHPRDVRHPYLVNVKYLCLIQIMIEKSHRLRKAYPKFSHSI